MNKHLAVLVIIILCGIINNNNKVEGEKGDQVVKFLTVGSWAKAETNPRNRMMQFAADHINNRSDILPDTKINLTIANCGSGSSGNPSQCIILTTLGLLGDNYTGVLSGSYTADQRVIQFAASAFGLPQISGSASGPLLSNKRDYPTYMRTSPSDALADLVMVEYIAKMGWKNVIMALEDGDWGTGNRDIVYTYARQNGIKIDSILCPTGSTQFLSQAEYIKNNNYNIIIVMLNQREAYTFLDSANKTGLVGPDYVWLCALTVVNSFPQLATVKAEGPHLDPWALRPLWDGGIGFIGHGAHGQLFEELLPQWIQFFGSAINPYYWFAFDAVMAYALALDKIMARGVLAKDVNKTELLHELMALDFEGATGRVDFDENGDRIGLIDVFSFRKNSSSIAKIYDPFTQEMTDVSPLLYYGEACQCGRGACNAQHKCECPEEYAGNHCEIHVGKPMKIRSFESGLSWGLGAVVVLATLLSVFAAFMLYSYWVSFSKHGSFYSSVIIFGTFFAYASALILLPEQNDALCLCFPWFLGIGFTLTYGCLFIKTWALFKAYSDAINFKKTNVTPMTIIKGIGFYLLAEIALLVIWSAVDPPTLRLKKMYDDTHSWQCESDTPTFWIIFTVIKGIWLLSGVILSVLTRTVSKEYSDSKSIAYATYNNMLLGVIAVPLALTLRNIPNGSLIIEPILPLHFIIDSLFLSPTDFKADPKTDIFIPPSPDVSMTTTPPGSTNNNVGKTSSGTSRDSSSSGGVKLTTDV